MSLCFNNPANEHIVNAQCTRQGSIRNHHCVDYDYAYVHFNIQVNAGHVS